MAQQHAHNFGEGFSDPDGILAQQLNGCVASKQKIFPA